MKLPITSQFCYLILFFAAPILSAVDAEVRKVRGLPSLCLDGKPVPALSCVIEDPSTTCYVSNGILHLGSSVTSTKLEMHKTLPADCDIEAEIALDKFFANNVSFGFTFNRDLAGRKVTSKFICRLVYSAKMRLLRLWNRNASGGEIIKWDKEFAWQSGVFHKLRLSMRERQVMLYLDGKQICAGTTPTVSKAGGILKLVAYRCDGRCRRIRVTKPDGTVCFTEDFTDPKLPAWKPRHPSNRRALSDAAANGIHIFQILLTLDELWRKGNKLSTHSLDVRMRTALKADPKAYVILRLLMKPPLFWSKKNPDEMIKGKRLDGSNIKASDNSSYCSQIWKKNLQSVLFKLVKYIDRKSWAGRLIGFQIIAGKEWICSFDHRNSYDYSPAQLRAFRLWLRWKYQTVGNLRKAWRSSKVTFATAQIPAPRQCSHPDVWPELSHPARFRIIPMPVRTNHLFLDISRDQVLLDYDHFRNCAVTTAITHAAKILKSNSRQKRVVGVYYGNGGSTAAISNKAHSDWANLLVSPMVDMFASSIVYDQYGAISPSFPQIAPASILANNKLFWIEDDTRISSNRTLAEAREMLKHTFAYVLTKNFGEWFLNIGDWLNHPPLFKLLNKFTKIMNETAPRNRRSAAEIVVLLGEQSYLRLLRNPMFTDALVFRQLLDECTRIGAPFDIALLADVKRLRPYKLYILPNAFYVSGKNRKMLQRVLRRDNRTALWGYASGIWTDKGLSCESASKLIGIRLRQTDISAIPDLRLTTLDSPWTQGVSPMFHHVSSVRLDPVVYADDPEATELGRMFMRFPLSEKGNFPPRKYTRKTGLAVRSFPKWNSIYCGVPCIPVPLLRSIARNAGVHLYGEAGDMIYASRGFLAIHTGDHTGERILCPPAGVKELRDEFTGGKLPVTNGKIRLELEPGQTKLWKMIH